MKIILLTLICVTFHSKVNSTPLSSAVTEEKSYIPRDEVLREFIVKESSLPRIYEERQQQHHRMRNANHVPTRFVQSNIFDENAEGEILRLHHASTQPRDEIINEEDEDFGGVWHIPVKVNEEPILGK